MFTYFYFHFFALVSRQSAALSSATQHTMPPELGGKWGTECLNTRFPLPTESGIQFLQFFLYFLGNNIRNGVVHCQTLNRYSSLRDTLKYYNL